LQAALQAGGKVISPAFTCSAVHQTLASWPGEVHLVDAADTGFLMALDRLRAAQTGPHALVLCEAFGHVYDLDQLNALNANLPASPVLRIVDMAMAVPHPDLFTRLKPTDFALLSFGIGKSMYTGWGAMGFSPDSALADEIRKLRDKLQAVRNSALHFRRATTIALRTLSHLPWLYRFSRTLEQRRQSDPLPNREPEQPKPSPTSPNQTSALWTLPAAAPDQCLALWNLRHAPALDEIRRTLAARYFANLRDEPAIVCPPQSARALSHFSIRLSPAIRDRVKEHLYQNGINATNMWQVSGLFEKGRFPNTSRLAAEILNLPLSTQLRPATVDHICQRLRSALKQFSL